MHFPASFFWLNLLVKVKNAVHSSMVVWFTYATSEQREAILTKICEFCFPFGKVFRCKSYVIKLVGDFQKVCGFPQSPPFSFINKTYSYDINEILLIVVLNTQNHTFYVTCQFFLSEWLLFNAKWGVFLAIYWKEQVTFQWDDDVRFVLDQHALLNIHSASSPNLQPLGRHVAPLGHILDS